MKVTMHTLQDKIDGQVVSRKESGILTAEITPNFYRSNAKPGVIYLTVTDDSGEVTDRLSISLAGSSAKLLLNRYNTPVRPAYYTEHPSNGVRSDNSEEDEE